MLIDDDMINKLFESDFGFRLFRFLFHDEMCACLLRMCSIFFIKQRHNATYQETCCMNNFSEATKLESPEPLKLAI